MGQVKAYVLENMNWWRPSDNLNYILSLKDDYVIWETDPEAVKAILDSRYPTEHSDMVLVEEISDYCRSGIPSFTVYDVPHYVGDSIETALERARHYGAIVIESYRIIREFYYADKHPDDVFFTDHTTLVYDPAKAKKKKRRKLSIKTSRPMKRQYIVAVMSEMSSTIKEEFKGYVLKFDFAHRHQSAIVRGFLEMLPIFVLIFGKNSYRQLESFQTLVREWKMSKKTVPHYMDINEDFTKFMEREAALPKPRKRKLKSKYDDSFIKDEKNVN